MANERLRSVLLANRLTPATLAAELGVDRKSVERWIGGRTPYRRHRYEVARRLQVDEAYLWPDALAPAQVAEASGDEILAVYPHRSGVLLDEWRRLFEAAERRIDILAFSSLFLAEDPGIVSLLVDKAAAGVPVRVALGDPRGAAVRARSEERGPGGTLPEEIRTALRHYAPLLGQPRAELRLHRTPVYGSLYRGDDQLLVNSQVYGVVGAQSPVLHLRRVAGGTMVTTYCDSFERVWSGAVPAAGEVAAAGIDAEQAAARAGGATPTAVVPGTDLAAS